MSAETFKINMIEEGVEKDLTREDVLELLYNDVVTVTFTKKDGTERVMECTLLATVLGAHFKPDSEILEEMKSAPTETTPTIAVWDIPSDGWRSFRMDSVKSISIPTS